MFATLVPFCFSTIFVSLAFTKLLHLSIHAKTVSSAAFAIFLPSLLVPDVLIIFLSRLALRQKKGVFPTALCVLGCIFSFVLLGAASSQLGFFYKTGNEIKWSEAKGYASDKDGMKILLSGINSVLVSGLLIVVVSWFAKWFLYRAAGAPLTVVGARISHLWQSFRGSKVYRQRIHNQSANPSRYSYDSDNDSNDSDEIDDIKNEMALSYGEGQKNSLSHRTLWAISAAVFVFLSLTTIFRPQRPYIMLSATLPLAMLGSLRSAPDMCTEQAALNGNPFPFPDLIEEYKWQSAKEYAETVPYWLPEELPAGFHKWMPKKTTEGDAAVTHNKTSSHSCVGAEAHGTFYNPISDPMKISNLDDDILDVLQEAFGDGAVKIKHVALIMMESYREELFPLQQGSDYHKIIMNSHEAGVEDEVNDRLSKLCPVAERITGKSGNFKKMDGSAFEPASIPQWNDTTPDGFGGINVVGGFTTSSLSFKSMAAIHCGAWSMPVDNFEESETQAYQPCIPQVLDLFNKIKENNPTDDFLEQQWSPAFFQSITDGYDRQDKFDTKIGFQHIVTKNRLDEDTKEGEELEEINYFGYAETTLKSHIRDYIKQVQDEGKRMFFSHFTSTTHHPWGVPSSFPSAQYLSTEGKMGWHEDFNNYLNSMRFTDAWLGELMQTFDDFGISNETLVIFVGDHGQAFKEDITSKIGTYENGHVSNFRVPITFRHPSIPRVQYEANATSLSILPTILDLLINTGSLNEKDTTAASDLIRDYEGQSLIRPYKASHNGRRAWNFGVINGGASMLSLTSADAPWRLVMPLDESSQYRFTDLKNDPLELEPLETWSIKDLAAAVTAKYGEDAAQWATEADAVAQWWGPERKRLWGYNTGDSNGGESGQ
ncbi:hypothetical protein FZEAL_2787 [Fusarium zealandicum]|uniref:Sulfatase N-terminal domain-containing protein n=1 Tax=Fusarium zealandicum TaxID=1053134 RepID=A0A8H4UQD6_9HYPO|nr:hypothetical protein FZEAL_2787 [Fusarium zealandicum]